jgi:hypothetical protein
MTPLERTLEEHAHVVWEGLEHNPLTFEFSVDSIYNAAQNEDNHMWVREYKNRDPMDIFTKERGFTPRTALVQALVWCHMR